MLILIPGGAFPCIADASILLLALSSRLTYEGNLRYRNGGAGASSLSDFALSRLYCLVLAGIHSVCLTNAMLSEDKCSA